MATSEGEKLITLRVGRDVMYLLHLVVISVSPGITFKLDKLWHWFSALDLRLAEQEVVCIHILLQTSVTFFELDPQSLNLNHVF